MRSLWVFQSGNLSPSVCLSPEEPRWLGRTRRWFGDEATYMCRKEWNRLTGIEFDLSDHHWLAECKVTKSRDGFRVKVQWWRWEE